MRALALGAALVAAAFLPGERLGLAVPLVAALVLATAWPAFRSSRLRLVFVALAVALAAQAALLDATWIVALDLAAAWVLGALAASGPALAALAAPFARLEDVPSIVPRADARVRPALHGSVLAVGVAAPFFLLFLSADAAFSGLAGDVLPEVDRLPARVSMLFLVLTGAVGLGLAARAQLSREARPPGRTLSFAEWAIPLALLDLLFAAFVTVQIAVLFGGNDRVLETAGLTYAQYARSGFWQLLAASALSFAVVGVAMRYARVATRREDVLLKALLVVFCGLTLVVLASALQRLQLYEDVYGLTRLRLLVETTIFWLGVMLVLVVAAVLSRAARARLVVVAVVVTALGFLGFSLSVPDHRIAERNIDRWEETGRIDLAYLAELSADATPALLRLPAAERHSATRCIRLRLAEPDPWSSANRSRARARDLLGL